MCMMDVDCRRQGSTTSNLDPFKFLHDWLIRVQIVLIRRYSKKMNCELLLTEWKKKKRAN